MRAASPASAPPGTGGGGLTTCAPRSWRTRRRRCTRGAANAARAHRARAALRWWRARALPLAAATRIARRIGLRLLWRRAAGRFTDWCVAHAVAAALRRTATRVATRRRGGVRGACAAWVRFAEASRGARTLLLALAAPLTRDTLHALAARVAERAAVAETLDAATYEVLWRRRAVALDVWKAHHAVEAKVRAGLWSRRVAILTGREVASCRRVVAVWRRAARERAARQSWLRLAEGHRLLRRQGGALRRWRQRTMVRVEAAAAPPAPLSDMAPRPLPPPTPSPPRGRGGGYSGGRSQEGWSGGGGYSAGCGYEARPTAATAHRHSEAPHHHHVHTAPPPPPPPPPRRPAAVPIPPLPPRDPTLGLDALLDRMVVMRQCLETSGRVSGGGGGVPRSTPRGGGRSPPFSAAGAGMSGGIGMLPQRGARAPLATIP